MNDNRISILHFSNSLAWGGVEEHILTLLQGLDRKYFRCHVVCGPALAEKFRPSLPPDVELTTLWMHSPFQIGEALRLVRIIRQRRVEILHSHLFYASLFASPIGWLCGVPVIVETTHVREQWRHGWLKSRFVVDRLQGRFVSHYIAVSHANARYLTDVKGLPARKVTVVQNGCNLKRFDPAQAAPPGLGEQLGFDEGDLVLFLPGRLEPQKGHSVLVEALPLVRSKYPNVRLVCAGDGRLRDVLLQQVHELGLDDCVRFVGHQKDIAGWFALCDMTVLPSFWEGLPLVAVESMAAGRPIVATAVDGTPEVVIDGKTGFTVPPGDATALAEAICRLLASSELRREFAVAGIRWVSENFSQKRQVQQTQELYLRAYEERTGMHPKQDISEGRSWIPTA